MRRTLSKLLGYRVFIHKRGMLSAVGIYVYGLNLTKHKLKKAAKARFFLEHNIKGIRKLKYWAELIPIMPVVKEISESPTVDIPDVPIKSAEPDELDEWIKGLGD